MTSVSSSVIEECRGLVTLPGSSGEKMRWQGSLNWSADIWKQQHNRLHRWYKFVDAYIYDMLHYCGGKKLNEESTTGGFLRDDQEDSWAKCVESFPRCSTLSTLWKNCFVPSRSKCVSEHSSSHRNWSSGLDHRSASDCLIGSHQDSKTAWQPCILLFTQVLLCAKKDIKMNCCIIKRQRYPAQQLLIQVQQAWR